MYGCHVVEPDDDGADLGVVFFHNAGYSTACGHGTIALVTWALDEGVLPKSEGANRVVVDVRNLTRVTRRSRFRRRPVCTGPGRSPARYRPRSTGTSRPC